ncbi:MULTISPECIES: GNAT family N-acetyltransferase [Antrihabitans]|uniref:GNAT family N-acetyltransferase n=2 Tax=Antrihabitans TaxID=2799491 RepID=A0A934U329_9NOCA|nr:GNAT family N-acetyltransferase [Antrihabitans stalagmiti]MBJ8339390.1 GNAT family N-acetyltransferase [Antrihabitans stalagmiti]
MPSDEYSFSDDPARIDRHAISAFLMAHAYWATWRTHEDISAAIDGSWRVIGCYDRGGELVGFARAISDGVNFGYLADVFVLPAHRGNGLGVQLVTEMIENGPGRTFRWMLHTADAHDLYRKFGFGEPNSSLLERASTRG